MGLLRKKADPISERSRALKAEIAALEARIKKLSSQPEPVRPVQPRVRSTAVPAVLAHRTPVSLAPADPVFEEVDRNRLKSQPEPLVAPEFYNELGVRKYDLPALVGRIKNHLRGKSAANPKLVTFLAAGSIQGLRPLRYEKRVARNRFIFLAVFFLLILWGLAAMFLRHR